ncbi:Serine protease nudel [Sarcoptes scabiei]|uniref:Serine protease nudel n=1 Tax=Sarcoptes scabiei TaxID=52283 RepID=A0A834RD57_SARSC|nr:Serine protease nudel [Sarcoptes scabiei]
MSKLKIPNQSKKNPSFEIRLNVENETKPISLKENLKNQQNLYQSDCDSNFEQIRQKDLDFLRINSISSKESLLNSILSNSMLNSSTPNLNSFDLKSKNERNPSRIARNYAAIDNRRSESFDRKRSKSFDILNNLVRYHEIYNAIDSPLERSLKTNLYGFQSNNSLDSVLEFRNKKLPNDAQSKACDTELFDSRSDFDSKKFKTPHFYSHSDFPITASSQSILQDIDSDPNEYHHRIESNKSKQHHHRHHQHQHQHFCPDCSSSSSSSSFFSSSTSSSLSSPSIPSSSSVTKVGLIKSCGKFLLFVLIAITLISLSLVLGFSLYMIIVTNFLTETSNIYSLMGNFRITQGDDFNRVLLNESSIEFHQKAERYRTMLIRIFEESLIAPALMRTEIQKFRSGSLIVFFRLFFEKYLIDKLFVRERSDTIINFGTIENIFNRDEIIEIRIKQIIIENFKRFFAKRMDAIIIIDFDSIEFSKFEKINQVDENHQDVKIKQTKFDENGSKRISSFPSKDSVEYEDFTIRNDRNQTKMISTDSNDAIGDVTTSIPNSTLEIIETTTKRIIETSTIVHHYDSSEEKNISLSTTISDDSDGINLNKTIILAIADDTDSSLSNQIRVNKTITTEANFIEIHTDSSISEQEILKKNFSIPLNSSNKSSTVDSDSDKYKFSTTDNVDGFTLTNIKDNEDLRNNSTDQNKFIDSHSSMNSNKSNTKQLIHSQDSFDLYSFKDNRSILIDHKNQKDNQDDDDEEYDYEVDEDQNDHHDLNEFELIKVQKHSTTKKPFVINIRPTQSYEKISTISPNFLNEFTETTKKPNLRPPLTGGFEDVRNEPKNPLKNGLNQSVLINPELSDSQTETTSTTTTSMAPFYCKQNEFQCNQTNECISIELKCNRVLDCLDGSDELQCRCKDYLQRDEAHQHKICDGIIDCADSSDETIDCPNCRPDMFVCSGSSNQCIEKEKICNGENDCFNGDDEQNCIALIEDHRSFDQRLTHNPNGFVHIRYNGEWAPLCFDSYDISADKWIETYERDSIGANNFSTSISISSLIQLEDMGQAICKANYYSHMKKIEILTTNDVARSDFFAVSPRLPESDDLKQSIWSKLFEKTDCKGRKVARIECSAIECGVRPLSSRIQRRIVGGQSSTLGSWPWQIALYREGEFQCGAVIIDSDWMITAAHCFYSAPEAHWIARGGILRRGSLHRTYHEEIRRIEKVFIHPEYVDKGFINDIALLKLDRPFRFSRHIRPICLPKQHHQDVSKWSNQLCTTIGWGKLYEHGRIFPDTLQEVKLPIITTNECRKRTLLLPLYKITENMFCAGFENGGKDACLGDSGGPMMCQNDNGKWILLGITSNGDGCGRASRPGVYTKVSNYIQWINLIMSGLMNQNLYSLQPNRKINHSDTNKICRGSRCPLGKCLRPEQICDNIIDCIEDSSDEINCGSGRKSIRNTSNSNNLTETYTLRAYSW